MTDNEHDDLCKWCGGLKAIRNPMGEHCDHLYWPDNLSDEAKRANGYTPNTTAQKTDNPDITTAYHAFCEANDLPHVNVSDQTHYENLFTMSIALSRYIVPFSARQWVRSRQEATDVWRAKSADEKARLMQHADALGFYPAEWKD